jgi:hypothetical protein
MDQAASLREGLRVSVIRPPQGNQPVLRPLLRDTAIYHYFDGRDDLACAGSSPSTKSSNMNF